MRLALTMSLLAAALAAQNNPPAAPKDPLVATSKGMLAIARNDIMRSADKIPEDLWSFKPTPDVRTIGQLFAHVADAQYEFCGLVSEGKSVSKGIEKSAKTKADIVAALKEAFSYCDGAYSKMTDANAPTVASFFGQKITWLGAMDFNIAHTMEHYGNLVTYMRIKGIVPPSSERNSGQ